MSNVNNWNCSVNLVYNNKLVGGKNVLDITWTFNNSMAVYERRRITMISRLDRLQGRDIYENTALAKINELVDAVNSIVSVQEKLIDSRFVVEPDKNNQLTLATPDHNKRLQDELDRTKKQLEIAIDALNEIDKNLITGIEMT